jgi:hypothetical protein
MSVGLCPIALFTSKWKLLGQSVGFAHEHGEAETKTLSSFE